MHIPKHAEVVEEGDITVHVGRRKTKVDFELRAHMEKRKSSGDDTNYMETSDLESGEEEVTFNVVYEIKRNTYNLIVFLT